MTPTSQTMSKPAKRRSSVSDVRLGSAKRRCYSSGRSGSERVRRDGQRFFAGIISDLSERKRLEETVLESERKLAVARRLDAIGQLTGGIAHDFNNLLTVITGNLELLESR